jgi:hypothetical protein
LDRAFVEAAVASAGLPKERIAFLRIDPLVRLYASNLSIPNLTQVNNDKYTMRFEDDSDSQMVIELGCTQSGR